MEGREPRGYVSSSPLPQGGLPETEMSLMLRAKNVFGTLPWREAAR